VLPLGSLSLLGREGVTLIATFSQSDHIELSFSLEQISLFIGAHHYADNFILISVTVSYFPEVPTKSIYQTRSHAPA
jgi:hypothetical protein